MVERRAELSDQGTVPCGEREGGDLGHLLATIHRDTRSVAAGVLGG